MKAAVTPLDVVDFLNTLLDLDRGATTDVVCSRSVCDHRIANHPTVQVMKVSESGDRYLVGMLGVLNGVFGVDGEGRGPIAMIMQSEAPNAFISHFILTKDLPEVPNE